MLEKIRLSNFGGSMIRIWNWHSKKVLILRRAFFNEMTKTFSLHLRFFLQEPGFESQNEESKTEIVMAFLKHQWKNLLISGIVIFLISIVICIGVILNGKSQDPTFWQYRLWSFTFGGTKSVRLLSKVNLCYQAPNFKRR